MHYRVDFKYGYIIYNNKEEAMEHFHSSSDSVRIRECSDAYDDGTVLEGQPIIVDLS